MSSILKWMVVLVLLIAVGAGGSAYWYYVRSDEMLRVEVLKQLASMAPDLKFNIERANFDFSGRVRLLGLSIQLPEDVEPALYVPETIVTLDDQQMTNFEKVTIQRLRFLHPQLHLIRERDGQWNWQGITWRRNDAQGVPEVDIEHGTIIVELQRERGAVRKLKLADLNVKSVPAAARKLTAVISTRIEPAGPLTATINADLDGPPLKVEAKWLRMPVDDDLLNLLGEMSPVVEAKLNDARRGLANLAATQAASSSLPANRAEVSGVPASPVSLRSQLGPDTSATQQPFGLKCNCDLHCRYEWHGQETPSHFQVLAELRSGQLSHVVLPFPLYEIRGSVYADPRQVIVHDLRAENGATRFYLNTRVAPGESPRLKLQVRNLQIDDPLKARLPAAVRKHVYALALSGLCDLDLAATQENGKLAWEGELHLSDGAVAYEKFPYPIRDVRGVARMRGTTLEIEGQGKASGVPVTIKGWIANPGPAHESEFRIRAIGVPVDSVLLDACPVAIRKALTELELQGTHDVWLRLWKGPGEGEKYRSFSTIQLRNCSCMLKSFPYRISNLRGTIEWEEDLIRFKDLKGEHDETQLTAHGTFRRTPLPGRLDLTIRAENGAFDRSLEAALPASMRKLWQEFQPSGRFDVDAQVGWTQGQPCQVELPRIKIFDGGVTMRSFSWPMQAIEGEFAYQAPQLLIKSVSAQHDDTQIRGRGLVTFAVGEPWKVRFDELHVDDLVPNITFRRALPAPLQQVFDSLNPTGKFSIATARQGTVEIEGGGETGAISCGWDVQVLLADCALSAGIRIEDIHGRIDLKGRTGPGGTTLSGQLDLDSISVFRLPSGLAHQISRVVGPFSLEGGQFTGGSRALATPSRPARVPRLADRISGDMIDGKLTLDVVADLAEEPDYRVQITLSRGRLESYAQQYLRGQSNLAGVINGWLFLWGKGKGEEQVKGRGELQIAPAALLELPVFVQVFRMLRLDAGDRTAFDRADVLFNIDSSRFNFDAIHLKGNTINMHGRGFVRFDGAMQLDFYSMLARNSIGIPVVHEIAGFLGRGWVGVKVGGHVGAPQARMVPVPELDEALKQFLGTFEQVPAKTPRPAAPRLFPSSR
jgi:hypothetical protein